MPDLGVDGNAVRPVGVEENGEYEVPIASEVGWYRYGSAPGEPGSSVLAGHIAYDGENGVFADLVDAELGSVVEITLDDGTALAYEIVELVSYDKTALPFEEIFSESGPDRIVLITCGGNFNPGLRSYESNVVAYASPVASSGA
ncbi:MAG: class F sortase [Acidimicrobiales bacterium]